MQQQALELVSFGLERRTTPHFGGACHVPFTGIYAGDGGVKALTQVPLLST